MVHLPSAISLFLCRDYIVQEKTRNVSLIHCFSKVAAKTFPVEVAPFFLAAKLTDGEGEIALKVVVSNLASLKEVFVGEYKTLLQHRLQESWWFLRARQMRFSSPGFYQIALNAENQFLAHCILEITK